MTLFPQTSFWDQNQPTAGLAPPINPPGRKPPPQGITNKQLEDWCYRLQSAANEARGSELEGDLLDLRDDILYALHQRF